MGNIIPEFILLRKNFPLYTVPDMTLLNHDKIGNNLILNCINHELTL